MHSLHSLSTQAGVDSAEDTAVGRAALGLAFTELTVQGK